MSDQENIELFLRRTAAAATTPFFTSLEELTSSHLASYPKCIPLRELFARSKSFRRKQLSARRDEMYRAMLEAQDTAILQIVKNEPPADAPSWKVEMVKQWKIENDEVGKRGDELSVRLLTLRGAEVVNEWNMLVWRWEVKVERTLEREISKMLQLPPEGVAWGPDEDENIL